MKILIDNGHGSDTPGKRSPDGKFLEYQYNRIIATRDVSELVDCGYDAELLVPDEIDISLCERVRRVNACCSAFGPSNVLLGAHTHNSMRNNMSFLLNLHYLC